MYLLHAGQGIRDFILLRVIAAADPVPSVGENRGGIISCDGGGIWAMPRVNIEDELFRDERFLELIIKLGSTEAALGSVVRYWIIGQKFWKNSDNGIPRSEWTKQKLRQEVIDVGLAEDRKDFIYVIGSPKHFGWLRERQESGRKGGIEKHKRMRKDSGKVLATPSKAYQNLASYSPSPSLSPSFSRSTSEEEEKKFPQGSQSSPDGSKELNRSIWSAYEDEYQKRYQGEKPTRNASVNSQIAAFGKRLGIDAPEVSRFYVRHNKRYYVEKQHTVGPMLADAEGLHTQWRTGRQMTSTQAQQTDRKQANVNVFESMLLQLNAKEAT